MSSTPALTLLEFAAPLLLLGLTTFGLAWPIAHRLGLDRAEKLIATGERHLVFVRPVKTDALHLSWVLTDARFSAAPVLWAWDRGPVENLHLLARSPECRALLMPSATRKSFSSRTTRLRLHHRKKTSFAFSRLELAPVSMKLSIAIPCYNATKTIRAIVDRVRATYIADNEIFDDDCSRGVFRALWAIFKYNFLR